MRCQKCGRDAYTVRTYAVRDEQGIRIVAECDPCHNPQPPKPRWFARLTPKELTAA